MTLFPVTPFPVPGIPLPPPSENDAFGVAAVVVIEVCLKSLLVTPQPLLRALARVDCIGAFDPYL